MASDTLIGDYLFNSTDYNGGSGTTIFDNDTYSGQDNDLTIHPSSGGTGEWLENNHPGTGTPFDDTYSYYCNDSNVNSRFYNLR